jgi:hypothetical protein
MATRFKADPLDFGYAIDEWRDNEVVSEIVPTIDDQGWNINFIQILLDRPVLQFTTRAVMFMLVQCKDVE